MDEHQRTRVENEYGFMADRKITNKSVGVEDVRNKLVSTEYPVGCPERYELSVMLNKLTYGDLEILCKVLRATEKKIIDRTYNLGHEAGIKAANGAQIAVKEITG